MKFTKSIKNILVAGALLISGASCTSDFEEINTNPNIPSNQPSAAQYFTFAQLATSGVGHETPRLNSLSTGVWSMHFTTSFGTDNQTWVTGTGPMWVEEYFNNSYIKVLGNLLAAQMQLESESAGYAMMEVWRVYHAHRMADLYGHIPYSEAGKALTDGILKPKYDAQSEVYSDMINVLSAAIAKLSGGGNTFGAQDLIYGGDHAMWAKFANSLKLRLANRVGNTSAIQEALNAPLITSLDDQALIPYSGQGDVWNMGSNGDVFSFSWLLSHPSQGILNVMTGRDMDETNDDPRLSVFFDNSIADSDAKTPWYTPTISHGEVPAATNIFRVNQANLGGADSPDLLVTAAEVAFLKAEQSLSEADFIAGVNLSLSHYGLGDDVEANYPVFAAKLKADFAANAKAAILTQKWVAIIGNGPESFAEVRRNRDLFYGTILQPNVDYVKTIYDNFSFDRLDFPNSEKASNAEGVEQAKTLPDNFWWN
ncbi:SusD/RagB family nutrient-binding outer membrane lipoprotein [Flammeovirga aprica]|uniref:SusD/RagB family nutrient-binding outer membrane lipoprotein n=1 Tax=Flammeovirga aprica JL-4 TaxID=694437 RepID=A0A7X9RSG0_9BACT|nr:SusD/RagB family nutrient-binding outer membrane lipoprotein [Flammeovirga aprica]NME67006.1 SusD/RagB family nutrient-binding outer membrane lipoprotein [Flammeovirga aprica JL-4]